MGRREAARRDAAFARGELGVDGQRTTVEERDQAAIEQDKAREQLLRGATWFGREFLTWLLWRSEDGEPIAKVGGEGVVALLVTRLVLRGAQGEVTELAVKGTTAPYSVHVRRALDSGLLVHSARVHLTRGERTWEATLDAEFLDIKSAKLPELLTEEEDDRLSERLDLAEQLSAMVAALLEEFRAVRGSRAWGREVVPRLKAWMQEGSGRTAAAEKARRAAS